MLQEDAIQTGTDLGTWPISAAMTHLSMQTTVKWYKEMSPRGITICMQVERKFYIKHMSYM